MIKHVDRAVCVCVYDGHVLVQRQLATIEHPDRVAHCFLVAVEPGPMTVGGPETLSQSDNNQYTPKWISFNDLDSENLRPEPVRHLIGRVQ